MKALRVAWLLLAAALAGAPLAIAAQEPSPAGAPTQTHADEPVAGEPTPAQTDSINGEDDAGSTDWDRETSDSADKVIVHVGDDAHLPKNEIADTVVAIFGSATSEGAVREAVVAIFGDARATGAVGQDVVAVGGDVYVNGRVGQQAVAVLGDLTLGPDARIGGEAVAVGGRVIRDPNAIVRGGEREISIGGGFAGAQGLRAWFKHCLLYARPLAFAPGLEWAWAIAFGFLAFYIVLALLFSAGLNKCVQTLETRPGETALAALLSVLATPVLLVLLTITVVGVMLIPILGLGLFAAGLFGKAVVLAWLGRRVGRFIDVGGDAHAAFAVLLGGLLLMGAYVLPVVGLIVYKLSGALGVGVVVYTLLLAAQARRAAPPAAAVERATAANSAPPATPVSPQTSYAEAQSAPAGEAAEISEAPESSEVPPVAPAPPVGAAAAPRAGFWIRMAALFIDVALVGIVTSILQAPGEILLIALAGYGALMWKLKGATIGALACKLQVMRLDGREIEWDTALVRALSCFLSLAAAGLGFIWIAFDRERQSWHDKIAGTVVVIRAPG